MGCPWMCGLPAMRSWITYPRPSSQVCGRWLASRSNAGAALGYPTTSCPALPSLTLPCHTYPALSISSLRSAGEVPVLSVDYADGKAVVKSTVGRPVGGADGCTAGGGPLLGRGGVSRSRQLSALLLLSCFMAALAALVGASPRALARGLGLPWLS